MKVSDHVRCVAFPCADVCHAGYIVPRIEVEPEQVSIVLISETAPPDPGDYYYADGSPLFEQTTVQAFRDAGAAVASIGDLLWAKRVRDARSRYRVWRGSGHAVCRDHTNA